MQQVYRPKEYFYVLLCLFITNQVLCGGPPLYKSLYAGNSYALDCGRKAWNFDGPEVAMRHAYLREWT